MLTGIKIVDTKSAQVAMNAIHSLGAKTVVITSSNLGSQEFLVCLASSRSSKYEYPTEYLSGRYKDRRFFSTVFMAVTAIKT